MQKSLRHLPLSSKLHPPNNPSRPTLSLSSSAILVCFRFHGMTRAIRRSSQKQERSYGSAIVL